jgi:hypothetical protein
MSTLTLFQGFFFPHFFHFFAFKNTLEKLAKWSLQWKFLVHPSVHSPTTKAEALKDNSWENVRLI